MSSPHKKIPPTFAISFFLFTFALAIGSRDSPRRLQNDGAIAQLVEQRTENPCVPGSIPGGTTKKIANS